MELKSKKGEILETHFEIDLHNGEVDMSVSYTDLDDPYSSSYDVESWITEDEQLVLGIGPLISAEKPDSIHIQVSSSGELLADTDLELEYKWFKCNNCSEHKDYVAGSAIVLIDEPPDPYTDTDSSTDTDTNEAAGSAY
ncbi:MAG: hypothetical protein R6V85_08065 [Polyangia bacterium]